MKVLVAGAAGNTGKRVLRLLKDAGHESRAIARKQEQLPELKSLGAEALQVDMERDAMQKVVDAVEGCDAIIFAAGAGPGSGAARKETVDFGGAAKLADAAEKTGVERYVMLSAMGLSDPGGRDQMEQYLVAKLKADVYLQNGKLAYTIVRPGRLTDDEGTSRIDAAPQLGRYGEIPREDVAAAMVAALDIENTRRRAFEILAGETGIPQALQEV